ncbi:PA0069 family radical SAM protein [Phragmitibacter flavus]|uniref:PA0069 family radical SAM protein n=1 Tax=Phragmitibacter flavus TaxID=2576071 RepID=A0A5R8KH28_9BACT|nr:PA0069 family radical SAM protein [Phragmitibacter flavus]
MLNKPIRGRGAEGNPLERFVSLRVEYDDGEAPGRVETKVFVDHSSSVISKNESPDLGMMASVNPYRGCEHGCAYCYARPTHEYLGFGSGVDFESRIMVKTEAPKLLRATLMKPRYRVVPVTMSGVTDCYQPLEKKLRVTRGCLEVFAEFRHPVAIITKNHLVTRDVDLLSELAKFQASMVYVSITSLDADLAHKLEPRASSPKMRLEAVRLLRAAGVPVGVSVAPMIPGLNDHEIPAILEAAAQAGAMAAFYSVVRLPFGVKEVFAEWLETHFPDRKEKILGRIRESQGQTMSHPEFGKRLSGVGVWAEQVAQLFRVGMIRSGLAKMERPKLSNAAFRRPGEQMQLELVGV